MRVLSRFTARLPNLMYPDAAYYLGMSVEVINRFIDLCHLTYGLQPLNERYMLFVETSKGILITRWMHAAGPGTADVQLNLEEASISKRMRLDYLNMHASLLYCLHFMHTTTYVPVM